MGRGGPARRSPLALGEYDPQANRSINSLQQHVRLPAGAFDVRVLADLLVRSSRIDTVESHLLSSSACSCGTAECVGRAAAEIAQARGLAAFAPLNPSESTVSARTFQAIPIASHAAAVVRSDAWGDLVEVLVQRAELVERHLLHAEGSCGIHEHCDARGYMSAAVHAGLRPFEPQGAAYVPVGVRGELWLAPYGMPTRLGPGRIHASALTKSRITFTEMRASGPASFVAAPKQCTCARAAGCLHRQLFARMTGSTTRTR